MASILYCSGHIHAAVRLLDDVERIYHIKVNAVCDCRHIEGDRDLQVFAYMLSGYSDNGFVELQSELCVQFLRQESYCTPFI
ncbi:hypothetical protein DPMN_071242 [Dreissena polymorpha]|uniref:Uncharacterized protein n=1 Tax=Dreissena polymorpha TaxID=45954 RepID=A0A9D4BPH0_DREPO|nr:hypothetical protein DPMN_071242 [Dreissena polymorpha]